MAELIAVIVVIGVLSAVATARISDGLWTTRGFYDQVLSQVQYGRKAAVAQRRAVFVRLDGGQSRLCYSAAGACSGADGVASPTGAVPFSVAVPAGVALNSAAPVFQFDALGRYRDSTGAATAAPLLVSVVGSDTLTFTVEHETGYVHP